MTDGDVSRIVNQQSAEQSNESLRDDHRDVAEQSKTKNK